MPTAKQRDLASTLFQFYQKPVAMVSLGLIFSIVLVISLAVFAIQPTLVTMTNLTKEIEDKTKLSDQLSKKIAALSSAQSVYTQVESRLPLVDQAIPPQPELMFSLKIAEKLATENKVIITAIAVPTIPDEKTAVQNKAQLQKIDLPVVITVTGDYLSIRSYIEALEASRRSFVIDTINFSLQDNRGDKKLQAGITLTIPYLGLPTK